MQCKGVHLVRKKCHRLWRSFIGKDAWSSTLKKTTDIAPNTLSVKCKNEPVAFDVPLYICAMLKSQLMDITNLKEINANKLSKGREI